jgi:hypothetical protein
VPLHAAIAADGWVIYGSITMPTQDELKPSEKPSVRFDPGLGWICSCTRVYVEQVDFSLDCHHWPLCEHLVAAARAAAMPNDSSGDDRTRSS